MKTRLSGREIALIALPTTALLTSIAHARTAISPGAVRFVAPSGAVAQQLTLPAKSLGLWAPVGARTEFLGAWRGSFGGAGKKERLVAHFYSTPTLKSAGGDSGKAKFDLSLDLWRLGKRRGARPVRLNHVALRRAWVCLNGNWSRDSDHFYQLYLRHLDSRGRTLMLQSRVYGESISGVVGGEALAVFPSGLNGTPLLQSFTTYSMAMGGEEVRFDKRDKRGTLMARVIRTSVPDMLSKETNTSVSLWSWNGRAFVAPVAKRRRGS